MACQQERVLVPACPIEMPVTEQADFRFQTFEQGRHWTFTAEVGSGPYRDPSDNEPPGFVHVVVQGGDLSDAFETFMYSTMKSFEPRDGLMGSDERERRAALGQMGQTPMGLFLGTETWDGLTGEIVLAPPFTAVDSIHADHVMFVWHVSGLDYVLSLHAWEPFTQSVATLRAVVASLPGAN